MKRFNLGFLKFGPLEQCADGRLMYYVDHLSVVGNFMKKLSSKEEEIQQLVLDLEHSDQKNEYLNETNFVLKLILCTSILVNILFLVYIISTIKEIL